MVVFNKAGAELVVEACDYLYSQFKETNEIGYKPRVAATVAIIGADEPSFKLA